MMTRDLPDIRFRLAILTWLMYKCLHALAPEYLSCSCIPLESVAGRSRLRSAGDNELYVRRTRTVTFRPRAFSSSGPTSWNSLTSALRDPALTIDMFWRKLKTELFVVWLDCRRARLCDDLSLIVHFEMSVIIIIITRFWFRIQPKCWTAPDTATGYFTVSITALERETSLNVTSSKSFVSTNWRSTNA